MTRTTTPSPEIEVIIPIHREDRPIERAVASVLESGCAVGAVVVCHNMAGGVLDGRLAPFGEHVRVLELRDGIPSPAGPLNLGLDAAHAPWVTCMGSDDHEQPGAPRAWVEHLESRPVDALVLPVLRAATGRIDIPPVRPGRLRDLDPVRDRLCHRTGPLMLVRTGLLRAHRIRMTHGLRTGEDLAYSTHVWMVARHIDLLAPGSPCYVEDQSGPRVTATPFPLTELLEPSRCLSVEPWVAALPRSRRHALAVRVVRESVLRAVSSATVDEVGALIAHRVARAWAALDAEVARPLSTAEVQALRLLLRSGEVGTVQEAARRLTDSGRLARVLPSSPVGLLDAEARPRHLASRLLRPRLWRD